MYISSNRQFWYPDPVVSRIRKMPSIIVHRNTETGVAPMKNVYEAK